MAVNPGHEPILALQHVSRTFGQLVAVDDVCLSIARGRITGLIGPNGAGKSTLFNCITGELTSDSGQVELQGLPVSGMKPDALYHRGLARTFQLPQPFSGMSVLDNLLLSAPGQIGERLWAPFLRPSAIAQQEAELHERASSILEFTTLAPLAQRAAAELSGGQQKLLELARVLMGEPQLILLDEPAAGVNPALIDVLVEKLQILNQRGISFLIIEHNMDFVMQHCDPIIAMATGRVIFEGSADQALASPELLDSYLGHTNTTPANAHKVSSAPGNSASGCPDLNAPSLAHPDDIGPDA